MSSIVVSIFKNRQNYKYVTLCQYFLCKNGPIYVFFAINVQKINKKIGGGSGNSTFCHTLFFEINFVVAIWYRSFKVLLLFFCGRHDPSPNSLLGKGL